MTIEELLKDKYKLRIPPTVYYELLADVQDAEEKQTKHLRALQNRCCALAKGMICQFCAMECEVRKQEYRGGEDGNEI